MRLLNTTALKVTEFVSERPKYAILSHTWGSEEIVLQDTEAKDEAPSSVKAGWRKIRGACALALGDGFDWIWIDTCCIDKSSSSELSEAINSMFRWYREAEICYAYLEDVPPLRYVSLIGFQDLTPDLDPSHVMSIEKDRETFLGSRWFTRGWTLQELIAPQRVEFHATDWSLLGTRSDLSGIINQRTMIDKVVLESNGAERLSMFSVWRRMQWAASRETTRVEDTAYCLLGIFEINMPLLYGEGDRAFRRLQEEIIRTIEDYSLIAWTSYDASPQPHGTRSSALASHPRDFGTVRLDTTCVPKAAIERDFDKDMKGISVQEPPGPRLIELDKEMMVRCIKPYFGGDYRDINHPQLQPEFSPPTLSPRGILITMFTTRRDQGFSAQYKSTLFGPYLKDKDVSINKVLPSHNSGVLCPIPRRVMDPQGRIFPVAV
ncbi:heterokaryon incompatibility protein [Colletotrichum simmondsii]|uniref:Heterokaryon incompatibility protein n=1 Tax=Colletotrichum simmondsii TaxID=703756 RepID=A0A135T3Z1_9PEZI|nr:heterokaryon incompatibility protein [Colletotrichum simmondsii]